MNSTIKKLFGHSRWYLWLTGIQSLLVLTGVDTYSSEYSFASNLSISLPLLVSLGLTLLGIALRVMLAFRKERTKHEGLIVIIGTFINFLTIWTIPIPLL